MKYFPGIGRTWRKNMGVVTTINKGEVIVQIAEMALPKMIKFFEELNKNIENKYDSQLKLINEQKVLVHKETIASYDKCFDGFKELLLTTLPNTDERTRYSEKIMEISCSKEAYLLYYADQLRLEEQTINEEEKSDVLLSIKKSDVKNVVRKYWPEAVKCVLGIAQIILLNRVSKNDL
jgi:hypothetical protein